MRSKIKLITVKGITVYLHFTLLLLVVWMVILFIFSGLLLTQLFWSVVFLLAVFGSIVLHEYGHAFAASFFGINAKQMIIYPFGGIASIEKLPDNVREEIVISCAGPLVSLCVGAVFLLFAPKRLFIDSLITNNGVLLEKNFLLSLGIVNLLIAFFNLVPAFPMDGGRILRALLAIKFNYIKASKITAVVSKAIAILFIVAGVLLLNIVLTILGVFILTLHGSEEWYLQLKKLVNGLTLKEIIMYDYDSVDGNLSVNQAADILTSNHAPNFIVMSNGMPIGTLSRLDVMKAVAEQDYTKKIFEITKNNLIPLDGDMPVSEALNELSIHEKRIYPVLEKEHFIGIINFQNVIEYLLIHNASSKSYAKTKSLAGWL